MKNQESDENVISSFSNNMLRFDPNDEKHKKYDLNNSTERQVDENCSTQNEDSEISKKKDVLRLLP